MSAYATAAEFRAQAHQGVAASDAQYLVLLTAASRAFDRLVGVADQFFDAGSGSAARVFYGNGTGYLQIGDHSSLTTVTMPSGYTVPDYVNRNGYLQITDTSGVIATQDCQFYVWPKGVPVTVTATWGLAAIPSDVKQAVIEMAILMWRGADPAFAKTAELAEVEIQASPLAQRVIAQYRIKYGMAVA